MLGKIGLVYQLRKTGLKSGRDPGCQTCSGAVLPADGVKGGDDKHFDAGNNGVGGGSGTGGWNAGGSNNGDGSASDDDTDDRVPWWWWLLCTVAPGSNNSFRNERSGVTAGFGEGFFQLIVRDMIFELARGLVSLTMNLCSKPFADAILGIFVSMMGLSIAFVGLVVSWLWRWRRRPDGDEQQQEARDDDHEDVALQDVLNITSLVV